MPLPLLIPIGMAIAGAMIDKEKPLRGAALGLGAGLTGGAALGAMGAAGAGAGAAGAAGAAGTAGAAGAAGAAGTAGSAGLLSGGTQAGMLAAQEAGLGASSLGWGGATTGMQGMLNGAMGSSAGAQAGGLLGSIDKFAKPVSTGMQVAQSMNQPEQPMQAPTILPPTASPTLAQIASQYDPMAMQQLDMQRRQQRKNRIGLIGSY